jgi:DNA polymerase-1
VNQAHPGVDYLNRTRDRLRVRVDEYKDKLMKDEVWTLWRKRFGMAAKLSANEQLAEIVYGELKYPVKSRTEKGKPATDEAAMEKIDLAFVKDWVRFNKYQKARGTFLAGIAREVVDGLLHPNFHLHTAQTYRSSSENPNFQNFPVRDEEIAKIIRRCFVSRGPEFVLVENDFKGVEVVVAACYHKDPVMLSYIEDPTKDMHRDMAMQIYKLKKEQVTKAIRHAAKNQFVFPEFYGSFYAQCAPDLWDSIERRHFEVGGRPLLEHLAECGITELGDPDPNVKPARGTFLHHIKEVEEDFWGRRFKVYDAWKEQWYQAYLDNGGFTTFTGFEISGSMRRNQVINYPVQGSAFHCLLWTLIHLQKTLRKNKMQSKIVGQIHDSVVADVHKDELDDYLAIVRELSANRIRKVWPWIISPLVIECEISPQTATWYEKVAVDFDDGTYSFTPKGAKDKVTCKGQESFLKTLNASLAN